MSDKNKEKKLKKKPTVPEKWFKRLRRLYKLLWWIYPCKRFGHIQIHEEGPLLIVGNHLHILDIIPSALATATPVHYVAKKEFCDKKTFHWLTEKVQCVPVARDGTDVGAMMTCMRYLKNGEVINIFPEGTRNKSNDIFLPFKGGAAALSIRTKTPILPMVQIKRMKMFKTSYILYGEPFEFSEYYGKKLTQEDIEKCDEMLRQRMLEMYAALSVLVKDKKLCKMIRASR